MRKLILIFLVTLTLSSPILTITYAVETQHKESDEDQGETHEEGGLRLDKLKELNIETDKVVMKRMGGIIEAVAEIGFNETRRAAIIARTDGWVEKVAVYANQQVNKHQLLAEIYSPEFLSAQQEYLLIHARAGQSSMQTDEEDRLLLADAAQRLRILGLTDSEIEQLAASGKPYPLLHVHSPISGTVIRHELSIGGNVTTGQTLYVVANLSNVWVDVSLTEPQLAQVKPGQTVHISVKAYPEKRFTGKILSVAGDMDESTRTVQARALVNNPGKLLKPGMFAEAAIEIGSEQKVVAVPNDAIMQIKDKATVFKREGEELHPQVVETGLVRNGWTEIKAGLSTRDEIVTQGAFVLKSLMLKSEMGSGHGH